MRSLDFTHIDKNGNPSLRHIALGESLSGNLLGILEQVKDLNGHVLSKMRGKFWGTTVCYSCCYFKC